MLIQVFDSLDKNHIGGVYQVYPAKRALRFPFKENGVPQVWTPADFNEAWGKAVEKVKSQKPEEWTEEDILDTLKEEGWKINGVNVTQVSY